MKGKKKSKNRFGMENMEGKLGHKVRKKMAATN